MASSRESKSPPSLAPWTLFCDAVCSSRTCPGNWTGLDVADVLETLTGIPVALLNDARAFAWAEHTSGAAQGADNALFVTLGTGVGGAIAFRW